LRISVGPFTVFFSIAYRARLPNLSPVEQFPSGHRHLSCFAVDVRLGNLTTALVSVPHAGNRIAFDAGDHPEVGQWIRRKLER
jgi:hypothetical protein